MNGHYTEAGGVKWQRGPDRPGDKLDPGHEFPFAQAANSGPAETNPDARPGSDGEPAPTEPAGIEGHDFRRDLSESGIGRSRRWRRRADAGRASAFAGSRARG